MERCRLSVYSSEGIPTRIPGSIQSCRIALLYESNGCKVVAIAEGDSVYTHQLSALEEKLSPSAGKPFRLQAGFHSTNANLLFSFPSGVDIESLSVFSQGKDTWKLLACNSIGESIYYEANGRKAEFVEASYYPRSWASCKLLSNHTQTVTTHQGGKIVRIDDLETQSNIRNLPTVSNPSSLTIYDDPASSQFVTTEYNQVCVWDCRASNPCVKRFQGSSSFLYASAMKSNIIAVGGRSRTIETTDIRKWKFQARWSNCLKYEVTSISFSEVSDEVCFVTGIDSEMVCGRWREKQSSEEGKKANFRSDSRWCGLSTLAGSDVIAGYNENGNIYVFDKSTYMHPDYNGEPLSRSLVGRRKARHGNTERPAKKESDPWECRCTRHLLMASLRDNALVHSLSGILGASAAMAVTYPLLTVTTRQQVNKEETNGPIASALAILKHEGIWSFYQGLGPALFGVSATMGIYFFSYEKLKKMVENVQGRPLNPLENLLVGYCAGAINTCATCPIWRVTTRMQAASKNSSENTSPITVCKTIYAEGGITNFWKGLQASLILCVNPAIQWMVYEQLANLVMKLRKKKALSSLEIFILGALGKIAATLITYPYIMIKSRMQAEKKSKATNTGKEAIASGGVSGALVQIAKKEGFKGLYSGLKSKITQSVANAAFMFLFKDQFLILTVFLLGLLLRKK